jgi:hypothetical protein
MTREAFIAYLESRNIDFELSTSGMIVITHKEEVRLNHEVDEIPSDVEFRNPSQVRGSWVKVVNPNVIFNMQGKYGASATVWLPDVEKIYPGVEFHNNGSCILKVLERPKISNVSFFRHWDGNIEGVDSNRLLNAMIKRELFI